MSPLNTSNQPVFLGKFQVHSLNKSLETTTTCGKSQITGAGLTKLQSKAFAKAWKPHMEHDLLLLFFLSGFSFTSFHLCT